jgi:hypothetical protein
MISLKGYVKVSKGVKRVSGPVLTQLDLLMLTYWYYFILVLILCCET